MSRARMVALIGTTIAVTLAVQWVIAAPSTIGGNQLIRWKAVRDPAVFSTSSTSYVDVTGSTTTVGIPDGTQAHLVARFNAYTTCSSTAEPIPHCHVRIVVNGDEMQPTGANFFALPGAGGQRGIERSLGPLPGGTYTVKVQASVTSNQPGSGTVVRLRQRHLTVEAIKT